MVPESVYQTVSRQLGLPVSRITKAVEDKHVELISTKWKYLRFSKQISHVEKGTIVVLGGFPEIVRGFPKMRRALLLKPSLEKHMGDREFYVEEKMNGYNVRVACINDEVIAITRGGFICPYTTYKIREWLGDTTFFEDFPEMMLCGEVVGLENPYMEKSYPEAREFGFFVFDIRNRITNEPIPVEERYRILKRYKIPSVPVYGKYTAKDWRNILKLVDEIGKDGREGIVMKSLDMSVQIKYTSNYSTCEDLRHAFSYPYDYDKDFVVRRLYRQAYQAYEEGKLDDYALELGRSILYPMVRAIHNVASDRGVYQEFTLRAKDKQVLLDFVEHLKSMKIRFDYEIAFDGEYVLHVRKYFQRTNDKIKSYLKGDFCDD